MIDIEHVNFTGVQYPCYQDCPACVANGDADLCPCTKCVDEREALHAQPTDTEGEANMEETIIPTEAIHVIVEDELTIDPTTVQEEILKGTIRDLAATVGDLQNRVTDLRRKADAKGVEVQAFFDERIIDQYGDGFDDDDEVTVSIGEINSLLWSAFSLSPFSALKEFDVCGTVSFEWRITVEAKNASEARSKVEDELAWAEPEIMDMEVEDGSIDWCDTTILRVEAL